MKNTLKRIKEECELLDESSKNINFNNFSENNQFNQNNEVLFGLLKNSNSQLSPDSNASDLFSSTVTFHENYQQNIKNEPYVLTSINFNTISNAITNNNYSIQNNQIYEVCPTISQESNIRLNSAESCNNEFIQYTPESDFQFGNSSVKMENFDNTQSSSSSFLLNTQLDDPLSKTHVDYLKSNIKSDVPDECFKKIERKRERNREAAKKCREKKNTLIESLQLKLEDQRSHIALMKEKMKLMLMEIKRLSEYISENIPYSNLDNFIDENQLNQYLDC